MQIVTVLEDIGSGHTDSRSGYTELKQMISNRCMDYIVITDPSRITRSSKEYLEFTKLSEINGIQIMTIELNKAE